MRNRFLSALLIVAFVMSTLAGCSTKDKDTEMKAKDAVTDAPTQTPTEAPTPTPTEKPTQEPTAEAVPSPTQDVVESPTFSIPEIEAAGSIDGMTYTNSEIGFSVSVPESWLVFNAEETYSYIISANGGTEADVETFRTQMNAQGAAYICYGIDTQLSDNNGTDNLLVQVMDASLFGGLGIETIISSFSKMIEQQYTSMGGSCTTEDLVKFTIDEQDVYRVSAVAKLDVTVGEKTTTQTFYQEYIYFMKNGGIVYMVLSTDLEDSASLAKQITDTLSFQ